MPRIDDYKQAVALGIEELLKKNPKRLSDQSKGEFWEEDGVVSIQIRFLNRPILISWPQIKILDKEKGQELPLQQQILILHYLNGLKQLKPQGEWISFQEIPDGRFYMDAFVRRAKDPLVRAFGTDPSDLVILSKAMFGAVEADKGDVSVIVEALPYVPIMLIIWKGDEEFPPDGSILFDSTIKEILSAEDIAWLAGMVVYPLAAAKKAKKEERNG
mgnify:CR=1 FL=1